MNLANAIIRFETEEMTDDEILDLFAELIKTGLVLGLQGSYGRIASSLIQAGLITKEGELVNG